MSNDILEQVVAEVLQLVELTVVACCELLLLYVRFMKVDSVKELSEPLTNHHYPRRRCLYDDGEFRR